MTLFVKWVCWTTWSYLKFSGVCRYYKPWQAHQQLMYSRATWNDSKHAKVTGDLVGSFFSTMNLCRQARAAFDTQPYVADFEWPTHDTRAQEITSDTSWTKCENFDGTLFLPFSLPLQWKTNTISYTANRKCAAKCTYCLIGGVT